MPAKRQIEQARRRKSPKRTQATREWWKSTHFRPKWEKLTAAQKKDAEELFIREHR